MREEKIQYLAGDQVCEGYGVWPEKEGKSPAILIAHAWMGQDDFTRRKAQELAKLGYAAFAADVYGAGQTANRPEEAQQLMMPLFVNRSLLQVRIRAAYDVLKQLPNVDATKIGAIGFCFGGLTVIELLRSGADVKGVVSFHGVLGNRMGDVQAQTVPIADSIKGALLVLHGDQDPLVSLQDILDLQQELNAASVNWQMNIYSQTAHAFTNPEAHDQAHGLVYQERTAKRAWRAMQDLFQEVL